MTFLSFVEGLLQALVDGYAQSRRRNQERLDQMYERAYEQAQIDLANLGPYDPERDGTFNGIMEGCEYD